MARGRRGAPDLANWSTTTAIHRALYRATGGLVGHRLGPFRVLLLTTTGRKSGLPRTLPLAYVPDGDDLVVVASNGGQDTDPLWWRNLEAEPRAEVQVGRARFAVRAHRADANERARLWPILVAANPMWGGYEKKTTRPIPVVVLRRDAQPPASS